MITTLWYPVCVSMCELREPEHAKQILTRGSTPAISSAWCSLPQVTAWLAPFRSPLKYHLIGRPPLTSKDLGYKFYVSSSARDTNGEERENLKSKIQTMPNSRKEERWDLTET